MPILTAPTPTTPAWLSTLRLVPPDPDQTRGTWHVVGLKFGRLSVGRCGRDAEFCLGWDNPDCPPTADYLCERFADPRWYVCPCRRCRGQVVLVFATDGRWAVQVRDRLPRRQRSVA